MLDVQVLIGLAVGIAVMQPGAGMHVDPTQLDAAVLAKSTSKVPPSGFVEFVLHLIPSSLFGAFAEGEVLPVLLLALLCGFGRTRIGLGGHVVLQGIDSVSHMLFAAFSFIMRLAPAGLSR